MRALVSLFAVACVLAVAASAMGVDETESAEKSLRLADSVTRLRAKIKRAQRILAEVRSHQNLGADAEVAVGDVNAALAKSFVIGDVGSGGTRLFVYEITGKVAKPMSKDACAQESQAVPTNLDLIYDAEDQQAKANEIVNHLLNVCVKTIVGDQKSYAGLGITTETDVKSWMAQVPMYYEATAGLRLLAQTIDRTSQGKSNIQGALWAKFRAADKAWRNAALHDSNERAILLTRVIPGALEGWYGFRAGVVASGANQKWGKTAVAPEKLIYFEVGGASAQVVFTLPPKTDGTEVKIDGTQNVFAEVSAVAEANSDMEAADALSSRIEASAGMLMNSDMDMSVMDTTEGPLDLKLTSDQPQTPLLYSKSFLGNGMNRFTNAILHKVIAGGANTECSKRTHVPCLDNPCWRTFAALTRGAPGKFAWDQSFCAGSSSPCPDNKALQDAYDPYTSAWVAPQFEASITRMIVGTDDFDKCMALARQVWASNDEHVPAYPYYQQLKEVRAALKLATEAPNKAHAKTHVLISVKSLETGKDSANDHPQVMAEADLRSFLRNALHLRLAGPFTYHSPMVGAYFTSILFDDVGNPAVPTDNALEKAVTNGGGFALSRYCAGCKYGAWGLSWTVGAADFFVRFGTEHPYRQEQYKAWEFAVKHDRQVPATNPDMEDAHFTVCADFLDNTSFEGTVAQAQQQCGKGWQNGKGCVVLYGGKVPTKQQLNQKCTKFSNDNGVKTYANTLGAKTECRCVPAN